MTERFDYVVEGHLNFLGVLDDNIFEMQFTKTINSIHQSTFQYVFTSNKSTLPILITSFLFKVNYLGSSSYAKFCNPVNKIQMVTD